MSAIDSETDPSATEAAAAPEAEASVETDAPEAPSSEDAAAQDCPQELSIIEEKEPSADAVETELPAAAAPDMAPPPDVAAPPTTDMAVVEGDLDEDDDERKVGSKNKRTNPGGTPNRCTAEQRAALERFLAENSYPSAQRATEISAAVGMTPKSVKVWFQNARAKQRRLSKANNGNALLFHNMEAPRGGAAQGALAAPPASSMPPPSGTPGGVDLPSLGLLGLNNESVALGALGGMAGLSGMPAMPGLEAFPAQDAASQQYAVALLQQAMRNNSQLLNPMGLPYPGPQWLLQQQQAAGIPTSEAPDGGAQ